MDDSIESTNLDEEDIDFIINCLDEKQKKMESLKNFDPYLSYSENIISYKKVLKKILLLKLHILKEKLS